MEQLTNLITAIICQSGEKLKYYQGFHDIVTVFLLTLDENLAFYCLYAFTNKYLLDFMTREFNLSVMPPLTAVQNTFRNSDP